MTKTNPYPQESKNEALAYMAGTKERLSALVANGSDHFTTVFSNTDWRDTLIHAEKIGLGTRDYELVRV